VPEVRRLLLAVAEPPDRVGCRLAWSAFRRRHQAVAGRCHAARRPPAPPGGPALQVLPAADPDLTDAQWARIAPLLPPQKPRTGRPARDHRTTLAGMLWVARTGAAWRALPARFGPWETVHGRYQRWRRAGLWQQILDALRPDAAAASELSL
jgi:transposase